MDEPMNDATMADTQAAALRDVLSWAESAVSCEENPDKRVLAALDALRRRIAGESMSLKSTWQDLLVNCVKAAGHRLCAGQVVWHAMFAVSVAGYRHWRTHEEFLRNVEKTRKVWKDLRRERSIAYPAVKTTTISTSDSARTSVSYSLETENDADKR